MSTLEVRLIVVRIGRDRSLLLRRWHFVLSRQAILKVIVCLSNITLLIISYDQNLKGHVITQVSV